MELQNKIVKKQTGSSSPFGRGNSFGKFDKSVSVSNVKYAKGKPYGKSMGKPQKER